MDQRGAAHSYAHVAAKGLTRSAAIERAFHGIRVNTVLPGFLVTAMTASDDSHALEVPLGRGAEPEKLPRPWYFWRAITRRSPQPRNWR
jgi:NAD(P)-dependent dehydrogenase (short-subunit alcohol dehydrogenase family)